MSYPYKTRIVSNGVVFRVQAFVPYTLLQRLVFGLDGRWCNRRGSECGDEWVCSTFLAQEDPTQSQAEARLKRIVAEWEICQRPFEEVS